MSLTTYTTPSVMCILGICLLVSFVCMDAEAVQDEESPDHFVRVVINPDSTAAGCWVDGHERAYAEGDPVTLTAHCPEGYHLVRWLSNDTSEEVSTSATYEFTMPDHEVVLTAQFGKHTMFGYDLGDGNHTVSCYLCGLVETESEPHFDDDGDLVCDKCVAHVHELGDLSYDEWVHWWYCEICDDDVNIQPHFDGDDDGLCDECTSAFQDVPVMVISENLETSGPFAPSSVLYFTDGGSLTLLSGGMLFVSPDTVFRIVGDGDVIIALPGSNLIVSGTVTSIDEPWTLGVEGEASVIATPSSDNTYDVSVDVDDGSTFSLGRFTVTGGDGVEIAASVMEDGTVRTASVVLDLPRVDVSDYGPTGVDVTLTDIRGTASLEVPESGLSMDCITSVDGEVGSVISQSGTVVLSDVHVTHDGHGFDVDTGSGEGSDTPAGDTGYLLPVAAVIAVLIVIVTAVAIRRRMSP